MKTKPHYSVGLAALAYTLVILSGDVVGQSSSSLEACIPNIIGDGHCDQSQNIQACGYDGGDCCECTCTSGQKYDCTFGDFACVDPDASCIEDIDVIPVRISASSMNSTSESPCVPDFFADGDCDEFNNVEECGFDDGDCCECTCVSTDAFDCGDQDRGGFACLDPSAPCVDEDDDVTIIDSSASLCVAPFFGDGDCDLFNNNEVCGYDSGDCCSCTCVSSAEFTCGDSAHGGYSCIDPSAQCVDDDDVTVNPDSEDTMYYGSVTPNECIPDYLADGLCDLINNDEVCGYDGGDCCQCTCIDTPQFTCGDPAFGGFACLDPGAPCVDDDDVTVFPDDTTTLSEYTETFQCNTGWISDGDCDSSNNNKDCRFDGGDCCECTCVSTMSFTCGDESHGGFECADPDAPCVDEDDDIVLLPEYEDDTTGMTNSLGCVPDYIADGICDFINNDAICDFDGGDCCECTCVSTEEFTCGDEFFGTFACEDPSAPCFEGLDDDDEDEDAYDDDEAGDDDDAYDDDDETSDDDDDETSDDDDADDDEVAHDDDDAEDEDEVDGPCAPDLVSDGHCDLINNDKLCGFDGGDCCECTCVSTDEYTCGDEAFECVDPTAPCFERDDDSPCVTEYFSDGICDFINNDKRCGFDGGDCCECTCVSTESFTCGDEAFECVDPTAPCFERDDDGPCVPEYFSDGICDFINNDEVCGFDGGDCCECTCVSTEAFTCGDEAFECVDLDAPCFENANDVPCAPDLVSNGMCDLINNDEVCGYDGGDCCECTCVSTEAFTCGDEAFECVDPSAPCENDEGGITSLASDTEGPTSSCLAGGVSNGVCDPDNNNEECGYDGGDCCECTCVSTSDFTCGDNNGFDCIDPDSSCEQQLVEAGTKTTIGVSTNTYDTRAGEAFGSPGCGVDGCGPELTRDGSVSSESRWGCAQKINPDGGLCEIAFAFEDPQDIMEVQVAFYKGDERSRTLQAMVNGEVVGQFDSNPATPFTAFDIQGTGVENITFTTVGLTANDWISLFEVRFMVKA